jgi:serine/threonine protein kinase
MNAERYRRLEELFASARAADAQGRRALLERVAQDDASLGGELHALLQAETIADDFLETPVSGGDNSSGGHSPTEARELAPGLRIGQYEIVRAIGFGGMGAVYEALQFSPRRSVALKILTPGLASERALRRFRLETEILARLSHSGIASVYEAGVCSIGGASAPFFAMELVPDARPVTRFVGDTNPDLNQRLELMARVCDAVQHGHERGVIHRDLKPANILIDASGQPKVIDYGVAALSAVEPGVTATQTVAELVGTLAYMSPEQARGEPADTRSDVYALGVILFELLTGQRPFNLVDTPLPKALRIVETVPLPRLEFARPGAPTDAALIVARAAAKDPALRYSSAGALADDIRRFLRREPVLARPPKWSYLLMRFAQRNRALVGGIAATFVALALGLLASLQFAREADQSRREAQIKARTAEAISDFLLKTMRSADPATNNPDVTVREALERAAERIDTSLADEPAVRARVHHAVGGIFARLNQCEKAVHHLRKGLADTQAAYGEDSLDATTVMEDLAWALFDKAEGAGLVDRALEIRRRRLGPNNRRTAATAVARASFHLAAGELEPAEHLLNSAIPVLEADQGYPPDLAFAVMSRAKLYCKQGRRDDARREYERAIELQRAAQGDDHLQLSVVYRSYANFLHNVNDEARADVMNAKAEEIERKRRGDPASSAPHP